MSTSSTISRTYAVFALVVLIAGRPLTAQRISTLGAGVKSRVNVETGVRATPESASDTVARYTKRHGVIGVALGICYPGAGQFYSAEYGKGIALLGITLGAMAFEYGPHENNRATGAPTRGSPLPLIALIGAWGYGIVSAPFDARRYNRKHASGVAAEPVLDGDTVQTGSGFTLRH